MDGLPCCLPGCWAGCRTGPDPGLGGVLRQGDSDVHAGRAGAEVCAHERLTRARRRRRVEPSHKAVCSVLGLPSTALVTQWLRDVSPDQRVVPAVHLPDVLGQPTPRIGAITDLDVRVAAGDLQDVEAMLTESVFAEERPNLLSSSALYTHRQSGQGAIPSVAH